MNRSALKIAVTFGLGVISFVGCGDAEKSQSERSSDLKQAGADIDLNIGSDKVEFVVLPPSEGGEELALKSVVAPDEVVSSDQEDPGQPEPVPVEPMMPEDSRIQISCKDQVAKPLIHRENAQEPDIIQQKTPSFTIGLEESYVDGTVGFESRTFAYVCGSGGALVSIVRLSPKAEYKLNATYANSRGIVTHKGAAAFQINSGSSALVKLYMKKIGRNDGSVDVDIIFGKDKDPGSCEEIAPVCAEIYAPVVCEGTAMPADGRAIALIIGPVKGENECRARADLAAQACKQNPTLMPQVSCKPIK